MATIPGYNCYNCVLFIIRDTKRSMASWDASYDKHFGQKVSQLTTETTEEEIKELYKNWATNYDKVYRFLMFSLLRRGSE